MKWSEYFKADEQHGLRLALNVFIATTILWITLQLAAGVNPICGIASMLAASEPVIQTAVRASRGFLRNTLVGCVVGMAKCRGTRVARIGPP
jgi:uncharacterized membrane protein YccC